MLGRKLNRSIREINNYREPKELHFTTCGTHKTLECPTYVFDGCVVC